MYKTKGADATTECSSTTLASGLFQPVGSDLAPAGGQNDLPAQAAKAVVTKASSPLPFFSGPSIAPVSKHIENSDQLFFLYGQEAARQQLRRSLNYLFRRRKNDDRTFYITIDSFNNPLAAHWVNREPFTDDLHNEFSTPLSTRQYQFVAAHYQRVLEEVSRQDLTGLNQILALACTLAINVAHEHNIKLFFSLDGIKWEKLLTIYKNSVTTKELLHIHRLFNSEKPTDHITFFEQGKIIPFAKVMADLNQAITVSKDDRSHLHQCAVAP